jgi:hypothetical protein
MPDIYVLQLEGGKYYVGKSDDVQQRIEDHMSSGGSAWTRKYKPLKVVQTISNASIFDEDKYTKIYMNKYGVDNVRGGSYVSEHLDEIQLEAIYTEIWAANDCCTRCGRKGHFIKDCFAATDVLGNTFVDEDDDDEEVIEVFVCGNCNAEFETERACDRHIEGCKKKYKKTATKAPVQQKYPAAPTCYRCGHKGHYSPDCYARSTVHGEYLDSDFDY